MIRNGQPKEPRLAQKAVPAYARPFDVPAKADDRPTGERPQQAN